MNMCISFYLALIKCDSTMSRKVKNFFGKKEATPVSFDKLKKELYNLNADILKVSIIIIVF